MALILNIETSTKNCSVSVGLDGKCIALCEKSSDKYIHAESLHQFIKWAFEAIEYKLGDIDAVSVSKGPGSYTGLRIGVSAAKGICFALEKPLIAIESLLVLANKKLGEYDYVIPMLDARRSEVYTCVFDNQLNKISDTEAKILEADAFKKYREKPCIFIGDGANKAVDLLNLADHEYKLGLNPSAEYMTSLAEDLYKKSTFEDLTNFEPFYLKDFVLNK